MREKPLCDPGLLEGEKMYQIIRYGKPNMANLTGELGKDIIKQILNTPAPDREKMRAESAELRRRIVEQMEREKRPDT